MLRLQFAVSPHDLRKVHTNLAPANLFHFIENLDSKEDVRMLGFSQTVEEERKIVMVV